MAMETSANESWLIATFRPVSLFSLRMSVATSSGAKTLLIPTPYALKLALIDSAFRAGGEVLAKRVFSCIKGTEVRFRPPEHAVVTNTFVKVRRLPKTPTPDEPYISSISFREFCFYRGDLEVGLCIRNLSDAEVDDVKRALAHVNYLGKRGSFFQYLTSREVDRLPPGFAVPVPGEATDLTGYAIVQYLDELTGTDDEDLFERVSTFSDKAIGNRRTLRAYLLPYRAVGSSKAYTHYIRSAGVGIQES